MRILAVVAAVTGCEYYRIYVPFKYLNRNGVTAQIAYSKDMPRNASHLADILDREIIVLPRITNEGTGWGIVPAIRHVSQARVVYEADDDLTNKYRYVGEDPLSVARMCDAMTVTTHRLAEIMDVGIPAYVCPNHIDFEVVPTWNERPDGVLITGSPSHKDDWAQIVPAVEQLLKDGVRVVTLGYHPPYLAELGVPNIPPQKYVNYLDAISSFKVGLAPVNNDPFNLGKSNIKALEYMACGVIPVCSDHPIYRDTSGHSLLVKDGDWYGAIRKALELPSSKRKENYKWVRKNYDIARGYRYWLEAYERIRRP